MKGIGNEDFYETRSSFGVQVVQVFLLFLRFTSKFVNVSKVINLRLCTIRYLLFNLFLYIPFNIYLVIHVTNDPYISKKRDSDYWERNRRISRPL